LLDMLRCVWYGRKSKLCVWIYNTCWIGVHQLLATKTRAVTVTLVMRMTVTDCTTTNKRSNLSYKSRSRLGNCPVGRDEVP
jgi:hypothetical protein